METQWETPRAPRTPTQGETLLLLFYKNTEICKKHLWGISVAAVKRSFSVWAGSGENYSKVNKRNGPAEFHRDILAKKQSFCRSFLQLWKLSPSSTKLLKMQKWIEIEKNAKNLEWHKYLKRKWWYCWLEETAKSWARIVAIAGPKYQTTP